MQLRTRFTAALGALGLAAAAFYAPVASADRVGFSLSFGGPGYSVGIGNYGYGVDYYDYWRPAPVVVPSVPYYRSYYYPQPAYVAPPVVYRPYPVYRTYGHHWKHHHKRDHKWDHHHRRHHGGYHHWDR